MPARLRSSCLTRSSLIARNQSRTWLWRGRAVCRSGSGRPENALEDAYAEVFFSDATTEDVSIPYGSTELPGSFLGVATTTPGVTISSVVFPLSQDLPPAFTNIRVGTYSVPEPSALALLATGVAGLLAFAWRKRK